MSFLLAVAATASCNRQSPAKLEGSEEVVEKISFGRRQVDQMLDDRPDMVGVLAADDPIVEWVIAGMNGDRIGQRIYWNGASPQSGQAAEHASPYGHYPPHINLMGGTETTGIDKWSCIVYELFNLENSEAFAELQSQAIGGELDGDAYARESLKLEYLALKKAEEFFREHPIAGAKPGHNDCYDQLQNVPATYEEYLKALAEGISEGDYNPLEYFKEHYEATIVPYLEMAEKGQE